MKIQSKLKQIDCPFFSIDTTLARTTNCITEKFNYKDEHWGSASAHIIYSNEFCLMKTEIDTRINLTDLFSVTGEYIQLSYLINGNTKVQLDSNTYQSINLGDLHLFYGKDTTIDFFMPSDVKAEYISIIFTKSFFIQLFRNESWYCSDPFFKTVVKDIHEESETLQFPLNYAIYQLTHELFKTSIDKRLEFHLFQLKFKEIFLQLCNLPSDREVLQQSDISDDLFQKIKKVYAYITLHFDETPTLKELARIAILNEFQLKTGFKKVYGITIRAYIIQLKMEQSKSLLNRYSVNETAAILGYKSVSHFIQSFKKYYGYTPKQLHL